MTTAQDIISLALRDAGVLGVGQTADASDTQDAFKKLNWLIAQWRRRRWLVFQLVTYSVRMTGAQSYSVGPGGTLDVTPRPDKIESAFLRQLNINPPGQQIDYQMDIIPARETYDRLDMKGLNSWSYYLYYQSSYPLGYLFPWPVPEGGDQFDLFVTFKDVLQKFTTINEVVNLPEEYEAALELNLAVWLCPGYTRPVDPELKNLARNALDVLRVANTQIPLMRMPDYLQGPTMYNIYSDQ